MLLQYRRELQDGAVLDDLLGVGPHPHHLGAGARVGCAGETEGAHTVLEEGGADTGDADCAQV